MDVIIDSGSIENQVKPSVVYAGFWPRLWALILDGLVMAPITLPLTYFNMASWKEPLLYILVGLLGLAYKPLLEFKYGATLGKMALGLKVVNADLGKINFQEAFLRSIIAIGIGLTSLVFTVQLFYKPGFEDVSTFMEYSMFVQQNGAGNTVNSLLGIIYIVELIFLLSDNQKRALHDRIGKTFVIKK